MGRKRQYQADGIEVAFEAERCIHAAECVRGLPGVFDPDRRPWIEPGAASADEVARVVSRCPSGALTFSRRDGGADEEAATINTLRVEADGPVYGTGRLVFLDAERREIRRENRAALCRCGESAHKPFCDGSHAKREFRDPGALGTAHLKPVDEDSGPELTIRLRADGPLVLDGAFELRGADGTEFEGSAGALCRCGASANKPFCDGSHRDAGFRAEDPTAD